MEAMGWGSFLDHRGLQLLPSPHHGVHCIREELLLCLSDHGIDNWASPTGTGFSLSVQQDEQRSAHQMVICPTSHLCCILIHSGLGLSPVFMLQSSSCQQLCQMASLKVMGCPDRLAPPSAAAFGRRDTVPLLALPLGCTRYFCQKDDLTHQ